MKAQGSELNAHHTKDETGFIKHITCNVLSFFRTREVVKHLPIGLSCYRL